MLGLCWAILGLCWAFVGSFGALLAAFGPEKKNHRKFFGWGYFLGRFWAYVGPFGGYVGPLLRHFRAMLGLCWVIWGSAGGFRAGKKKNQPKIFSVGFFFGSVLGLCWAIWRLCWASVGHFRAMLGLCWVIWVLLAAFGPKKIPPTENFFGWG